MKKTVALLLCFILLLIPLESRAVSPAEAYRNSLIELISLLTKQLNQLQAQLASQTATESKSSVLGASTSIDELMPSQFYDGNYLALYATNGTSLIPLDGTKYRALDRQLWNRFVTLVGSSFVSTYLQEFRIYSDADAEYDAFSERDTERGKWILAVNVYKLDLSERNAWQEMDQLFIHEVGHMVVDEYPDMFDTYVQTFWNVRDLAHADAVEALSYGNSRNSVIQNYYYAHQSDFVSEYAATSPLEDIVESFTYFVLGGLSVGRNEKDSKINFFYSYPKLKEIRAQMRNSL